MFVWYCCGRGLLRGEGGRVQQDGVLSCCLNYNILRVSVVNNLCEVIVEFWDILCEVFCIIYKSSLIMFLGKYIQIVIAKFVPAILMN